MALMSARYPGSCGRCGGRIAVGEQIDYDRSTRVTRHATCPVVIAPAAPSEILNRPNGFVQHEKPAIGAALLVGDHAEIVVATKFLRPAEAEDFDMFEFADYGGWYVYHRAPATDSERELCRQAEESAAEAKRKAAEERQEKARAEQERKERIEREKAEYAAWRQSATAGLVETSVVPRFHEEPRLHIDERQPVYQASRDAGWYTTGDAWFDLTWEGERIGLWWSYGNAFKAFVPRDVADRWYQAEWEKRCAEYGAAEHAVSVLTGYGKDVYGGDYNDWVRETVGETELLRLAKTATHRYEARYNNNEQVVERLRALGIDARLIEPTTERVTVPSFEGQILPPTYGVWIDRVDGTRWVCPSYGKMRPAP